MLRSHTFRLVTLALGAVVAGCNDGPTALTPLRNAQPLIVQFTTTTGISLDGLPRATIDGGQGSVRVKLDVAGSCAMLADVRADYAGNRVDVWVHRSANPAANCLPAAIGYEYDVAAFGLGAGPYDVRVVDQLGDQQPQLVSRATATVLPVY